ncbi:MAG: ATP-binding protein, partial [Spirochaetota bacterium]|nr:ATP-binding protein [Spirochaetota bacterium]
YCTGDVREAEIYKAVNVDQVKRIGISPLEYRSILEGPKKEGSSEEYQPAFNVQIDGGALDDLNSYVDELKIRSHRLKRDLSGGTDEIKRQLIILTDLVDDLEKFARRISLVQLSEILQHHRRLVRDQARKLDKDVQLVLKNCDITVDRRAAELLSEMVVHLLRNAVVHGIESPVERARKNKQIKGTITIEASMKDGQLQVSVEDDGAGIDQEKIRRVAYEKGVKIKDTGESDEMSLLMSYLVYPGVSTHGDADAQAGRGFGLDIVYQKVQQFEGGSISVRTKPGLGTTFSIRLPSGFSIIPLLVVRYKQKMYALPAKYIEREITDLAGTFSAGESGEMLWNGMNVFTPEGRLFYTDTPPEQPIGIEVSYLKKKALILVDEILFRKEVPEDSMTLYIAGSPNVHKMDLYGVPSDFYYLSPSMVAT